MALSQRKKGGNWYWRETIEGIDFFETTGTTDKALAKEWAAKRHEECYRTIKLEGHKRKPLTVAVLVEKYLASIEGKPTYRNIEMNLNKFKSCFAILVKDLTRDDIQAIVNAERAKGNKEGTIGLVSRYWNTMINFGLEQQLFVKAPKLPSVKKPEPKKRHFSEEEEELFLKALEVPTKPTRGYSPAVAFDKQNNFDATVALFELGCRWNEVANLTWNQVSFEGNSVYIKRSKNGVHSSHLMTARLRGMLERRWNERDQDDYVFPTKYGKRYKESTWVKRAVRKAGLSEANGTLTLHAARRTYATRMDADGVQTNRIQKLLGHKNINTTLGYIDSNPDDIARQALAVQEARAARKAKLS